MCLLRVHAQKCEAAEPTERICCLAALDPSGFFNDLAVLIMALCASNATPFRGFVPGGVEGATRGLTCGVFHTIHSFHREGAWRRANSTSRFCDSARTPAVATNVTPPSPMNATYVYRSFTSSHANWRPETSRRSMRYVWIAEVSYSGDTRNRPRLRLSRTWSLRLKMRLAS